MLRAWTRTCFQMSEASPLPEAPPADTLGRSGEPIAPCSGPGSIPGPLMPWHGNTPRHATPRQSRSQHTVCTKPPHTCAGPAAPRRPKGKWACGRSCGRRGAGGRSDTPAGTANARLWDHNRGKQQRWPGGGTSRTYLTNGSRRREVVLLPSGVLHKAGREYLTPCRAASDLFLAPKASS